MRLAVAAVLSALALFAQTPDAADSPEIIKARQESERIRLLVDAGAMPRAALDEAGKKLIEAEDNAILRRTLYGSMSVEDLTEDQSEQMVAAARRQLERQQREVAHAKQLIEAGVAPQTSLTPALEELDRRKKTIDLAESRARVLAQLAEMVRSEQEAQLAAADRPEEPRAVAEKFEGSGAFTPGQFQVIQAAYTHEFGHVLPVSAKGETALHRSMGFDHRGRVDVALNPDQKEGVWLRKLLEMLRVPYFAFRRAVPGKATAAHIHIGPPSARLRAAD